MDLTAPLVSGNPSRPMTARVGLSTQEAESRRRNGRANVTVTDSSRSYAGILRSNLFSFFNAILFIIGVALLALGQYSDALISVGLGLLNAAISAVQEIRAKRKLDRLQLLHRELVRVVRDGVVVELTPDRVVQGDVIHLHAGDQIVVDGPVLDGGWVEVDESLLTGEADPILKQPGHDLLSGSACTGGRGYQLARDVGGASHANRLTADARLHTTDTTPLQRRIDFVVRLVIVLVVLMSATILLQAAIEGLGLVRTVQTTAVLSGLVPYGLFLLVSLSYTIGAVKSGRRGALVQQVNAVESVSNVDVVCTDKTGTLTTGRLTLAQVQPLGCRDADDVRRALGVMAHSTTAPNLTTAALVRSMPGPASLVRDEVAFSSALRWSAVHTEEAIWVLGAPETLAPSLDGADLGGAALDDLVRNLAASGLRVLVFAEAAANAQLRDADDRPQLPALHPLALVSLADELRDDVAETITRYLAEGIDLKVLSGDAPRTVASIATQAGLPGGEPVSGLGLDALSDADLDRLVSGTTVFGRVAPEQKERIVRSLRRQGRYVAMIGDGVNDARALKEAHVGVAMSSGSAVTRDVADIVLTGDSFGALLPARQEGRRIIAGIATSMNLFLTRVATQGLVILAVTMLGLGFPYSPSQVGLTLLTVGVPSVFLTAWAEPSRPDDDLLGSLARFVLPAAVITAACGVLVYTALYTGLLAGLGRAKLPADIVAAFENSTGLSYDDAGFSEAAATIAAQTGLSTFIAFASFGLILFLKPPNRAFASWTPADADRRPTALVAGLVAAFCCVLFVPFLTDYFGLARPAVQVFVVVLVALLLWFVALSVSYRSRLLDRVLRLSDLPRAGSALL